MAGGMDLGGGRSHGKKSKKRESRRLGIRMDMTPLVDVAFLLLTFFMLTTTFSLPQVMEINLPPSESRSEVTESTLLLLRILPDGRFFWNFGTDVPKSIPWEDLRSFLKGRAQSNPNLITLVKVDRKSKYENSVRIIDELYLAQITKFSLAPLLEQDKKLMGITDES